jgi:serine/threonine protein kinase
MKTALPLKHDNLVRVFGAGKKSGYCWVSMELVEGDSLQQVIRRIGVSGMLDWRHAYRVALHVGRALEYAHQRRVLHRNLTPQNVLIRTGDHLVKLGDLMLAKALEGRLAANLTPQGELLGDLNYMAPEQTVGSQEADERSDIYSLGALVYALLTGRPPFEGGSLKETLKQIRTAKPARPRQFQLSIPERFEGTVLTMLAKKPENRFQSAGELLEDLERMARFQNVEI